jgi:hypothetical protein
MCVDLGSGKAAVAEDLLHCPEIGTAVQQMGGRAVAQGVRTGRGGVAEGFEKSAHDAPDLPRVHALAALPQE